MKQKIVLAFSGGLDTTYCAIYLNNIKNYEILMSKDRKNCMCTGMLYDPQDHYEPEETKEDFKQHSKLYDRFMRIKQWKMLKPFMKREVVKLFSIFS